ncbi:helix-turn-helix domain-containing protein [Piscinibacter gummiphilus]|uniref:helix-turn-helix domain-containing protein n=1 Tax=Piscinibacter gummiphilus TaxID=946333 RepID=UPI0039B8790C
MRKYLDESQGSLGPHDSHLTEAQRVPLDALLIQGHNQRYAARQLGVSPSTVSREVKRARDYGFTRYVALFGQRAYAAGRKRAGRLRRRFCPSGRSRLWRLVRAGWHRRHRTLRPLASAAPCCRVVGLGALQSRDSASVLSPTA